MKLSHDPVFIAEISSNHNSDIDRCLEFIETAAEIGCHAVKFQLFKLEELFAPEVLRVSEQHRKRKAWELPAHFIPILAKQCKDSGLLFSCSPFYLGAVTELEPYVDFYKIASYELLWDDLLTLCAETQKPMVISTGMATLPEVNRAVEVVRKHGCKDLTLLHCVSSYPASKQDCNLAAIETMRTAFDCPVGWSDHTVNPNVILRAIHKWSATLIEFHLDLDGAGEEYEGGHCWLPREIADVIESVLECHDIDGSGQKLPATSERDDRGWRADPSDGLRPRKELRDTWQSNEV